MSYYSEHPEKFQAYRKKKAAGRKSDEEVRRHLASAMPETYAAIVEGVKKNREPYNQTKEDKAKYLYTEYRQYDKKHGLKFGLTVEWILRHIVNGKCAYCGNDDWTALGTDRIDNSKGHTPDNVVCCCVGCNNRKQTSDIDGWLTKIRQWRTMNWLQFQWLRLKLWLKAIKTPK